MSIVFLSAISFACERTTRCLLLISLGVAAALSTGCHATHARLHKKLRAEQRRALREHNFAHAAEIGRRLVQTTPRDNGARAGLAQAQIGLGDLAGARQTLADWPRATGASPARLARLEGEIALRENAPARAVEALAKAAAAEPTDLRLLAKLAHAHRAQGQAAEEEAVLSRMLALEENPVTLMERALCRRRLHRWPEALADNERAHELAPDDPEVRHGARLFARLARALDEIRELDARVAVAPDDDQRLTDRALLFLRSDDAEMALIDSEEAGNKAPWAARPKLFRALALIALGRADECEPLRVEKSLRLGALSTEFLDTISRLDSEISLERSNPDLYLERAWQLNEIGQPRLALEDADTVLQQDADSAGAHAERSYALTKLARPDEALEQIKRATELDPKFATAWQYRGELELAEGEQAAAADSLSRALALTPTYAALQKREQAYRQLGEIEKADEDLHALEAQK